MAYQYNINTSKKDNHSSICLLLCHKLTEIVDLFLSTFLVAYIYNFCGDIYEYINNVGLYEVCTYAVLMITFVAVAPLVEKSNRVWIYRIALFLRTGLVILAVFYGKQISQILVLAGALNGLSMGFYYASFNTLQQEMVSRKSMGKFIVIANIFSQIINAIVPIILGALIEISTYTTVAIYIAVICVIQIIISFFIGAKRPEGSNFSLRDYHTKLKANPILFNKIKFLYIILFFYGMSTIINTLLNICIMMQFGSSFSLGVMVSIFAIFSIVTIIFANKFTKPGKRKTLYSISAILPVITTILFVCHMSLPTLIIYNIGISFSRVIVISINDTYRNSYLKEAGLYDCITEHQTVMEIIIDLSRLFAYAFVFIFATMKNLVAFKILLCFVICTYPVTTVLLAIFEKKYMPTPETQEKQTHKIIMNCLKDL